MAYIDRSIQITWHSKRLQRDITLPFTYNVCSAVGRNCPNQTDDVMLVQTMLKMNAILNNPSSRIAALKIDGVCGRKTIQAIFTAQEDARRSIGSAKLLVDGVVGRALGTVSPQGNEYLIIHLNRSLFALSSARWSNLAKCVEVPAALKRAIAA